MKRDQLVQAAAARSVLGAVRTIFTYTSSDGVKPLKLPHGWWVIKAYDSETYWFDGNRSDLDNYDVCDRIEPGDFERFLSFPGHEHVTVEAASGGTVKVIKRDN